MDKDKYFSDYEAFTENEMLEITARGISLKNGMYIGFDECTGVWAKVNLLEESKCVGERDIIDGSFTFYTLPKPIMIKFIKKKWNFWFAAGICRNQQGIVEIDMIPPKVNMVNNQNLLRRYHIR